jgi:hypothetical protein
LENKTRKENEEKMNGVLKKFILLGFSIVRDHDESTGKEEYAKIQEDDEEENYSTLG